MKLHVDTDAPGLLELSFFCPGCACYHRVKARGERRPLWAWNGSMISPTLSPSIHYPTSGSRCHCFIEDGKIRFLADCDHELAGQTVEIPEWHSME